MGETHKEMTVESSRLLEIAKLIIPGRPIADIGSDHALLPVWLVFNETIPWAIASEFGDNPYIRMERAVASSAGRDRILPRQGNGLEVLAPAEVDGIVIAGMGGDLIASILVNDWAKSESFSYYILQPMSKPEVLRKVLADRGWPIERECLVMENNHYYVIIQTRPGQEPYQLNDLEKEIGPLILKGDHPLRIGYLNHIKNKHQKVYDNLKRSKGTVGRDLRNDSMAKIHELEVLLDASNG